MKIISSAGYYGTGSSAIVDLLREFSGIQCTSDNYEVRFIHDIDGISDLEHYLIENPNRHNSTIALKRFNRKMKFLNGIGSNFKYRRYFNNRFYYEIDQYCTQLKKVTYPALCHMDAYDQGVLFFVFQRIYNLIKKRMYKYLFKKNYTEGYFYLKKESYCTELNEQEFLNHTRALMNKLFSIGGGSYLLIDQLLPSSNLERYVRYFDDIHVFVVDRDPRDLYLLNKYCWHSLVMPSEDVNVFCEWFLWSRRLKPSANNDKILNLKFEDLIYHYEQSISAICSFLEIDIEKHIYIKRYFNPVKSISNTMLWRLYENERHDIEVIEKRLSEYCYQYSESDIQLHDKLSKKNNMF